MRRPRTFVLAFAVLFAGSSLVLVFATSAYDPAPLEQTTHLAAQTAELAGDDADGNGIRDDVDEFIAANFKDDADMRHAARQIARSIQPALALDLSRADSTSELAEHEVAVMSCVIEAMGPARRAEVESMINLISDKTYDTSLRFQQREVFRQRASHADLGKPAQCEAEQVKSAQL